MKLTKDDGTVIEELPDDAAVFYVNNDAKMRIVVDRYPDGDPLPFHVRLVRALLSFLTYKANVELVLRHAPTLRNPKHRHH